MEYHKWYIPNVFLFVARTIFKGEKKTKISTYHICSSPITQMQITGKQNEVQRNNIYNKNRRFV